MSYKQKPLQPDPLPIPERIKALEPIYDRAGLIYERTATDLNEMRLLDAIQNKPDSYKCFVVQMYRVKTQKQFVVGHETDEALVYYRKREAILYNGEPIGDDGNEGVYHIPITRPNRNVQGRTTKTQVLKTEPFFTIPFTPEAVEKAIGESETGVDQFYLTKGSNTGPDYKTGEVFTIWNKEDYKTGTFDELWDMSKYNYTKKDPCLKSWRAEGTAIKKQVETFQTIPTTKTVNR